MSIKDLDLYNDLEGVAAFLKSLDIFVTISNSTAHLAGSLGVKTILIKPDNYALFHYWNQKNNKTPWYNCVELIEKKDFLDKKAEFFEALKMQRKYWEKNGIVFKSSDTLYPSPGSTCNVKSNGKSLSTSSTTKS